MNKNWTLGDTSNEKGASSTMSKNAGMISSVGNISNSDLGRLGYTEHWDLVEANHDMMCVRVKIQNQDASSNPKYLSRLILTLYPVD